MKFFDKLNLYNQLFPKFFEKLFGGGKHKKNIKKRFEIIFR